MKHFLTLILLCTITTLCFSQEGGGRSPAGERSGREGGGGNAGGNGGSKDKTASKSEKAKDKATYEKDRSKAADRGNPNLGNTATDNFGNDGKTGGPTPSSNPRGTNDGRTGTQSEAIKDNDKTPKGRDKNNSEGVTDADRNPASSKGGSSGKTGPDAKGVNTREPDGARKGDADKKAKPKADTTKTKTSVNKPVKVKFPKIPRL